MSAAPAARSAPRASRQPHPDGYTLLAGSMGSHVAAPVALRRISSTIRPRISCRSGLPRTRRPSIVARKDFPAKNLKEFVAYLKANGDKVKQAHGGVGSSSHMACLLFNTAVGVNPTLVAYRGTGPGAERPDRRPCRFLLRAGGQRRRARSRRHGQGLRRLRRPALGRSAGRAVRQGARRAVTRSASGARSSRPRARRRRSWRSSSDALDKALDDPTVIKRLADLGGSIPPKAERSPAKFEKMVKSEISRWKPILEAAAPPAKSN